MKKKTMKKKYDFSIAAEGGDGKFKIRISGCPRGRAGGAAKSWRCAAAGGARHGVRISEVSESVPVENIESVPEAVYA